jgi:hypothetical protein
VTGDFLRPEDAPLPADQPGPAFRSHQSANIAWFHRLFRRRLAEASGLPVALRGWDAGIDTRLLYALADVPEDAIGWARLFSATAFPAGLLDALAEIFADALVVSFELAEGVKRALTHLRIPFIDFSLHPIRFLPDVFFAVQTNHPGAFEALRPHHLDAACFYDWADLLAASAVKMAPPRIPDDCTVIVGQTSLDRSLIRDGRLHDLADFGEDLRALRGTGRPLLFKPHPYNPGDFGLYGAGLPFRALRTVTDNTYLLLADDRVAVVAGINSSVLAEARYFGKETVAFAPFPAAIAETAAAAAPGQYFSVYDACFDADFWRDILAPMMPVTATTGLTFRRPPNTLRLSLRNFWGFNEVTTDFIVQLYDAGRPGR